MARDTQNSVLEICETFTSIQGESTHAGLSCFFIRLAGCNLRCSYCDTTYAYEGGKPMQIDELIEIAVAGNAQIIEITGGEPLMQAGFRTLAEELRDRTARPVLVETNGSMDISVIPEGVIAVMDIKCPGSGVADAMDMTNIGRLRSQDEVKFVISDHDDYKWAAGLVRDEDLASKCNAVLFSPLFGELEGAELGRWIVEDGLPARLQAQLHKIMRIR